LFAPQHVAVVVILKRFPLSQSVNANPIYFIRGGLL